MLSDRYSEDDIRRSLISRSSWHPYPTRDERDPWLALPSPIRQAHIERGAELLGHEWPALPATLFLEFARNGNRRNYESPSFARRSALCSLVIAECMEGESRFLDDILNGVWAICEETFWGIPACLQMQEAGFGLPDITEPVVPLFVGETVSLIAWVEYLLGPQLDQISPRIRPRLLLETRRRVLEPCLEREDFWWMGFGDRSVNNWNPWVNSNWLTAVLVFEEDVDLRVAAVSKILRSLDNFIDPYPLDGGCDEGPGYWGRAGASLFDCLELLHAATGGAIDVFDEPLIQDIGRYIYKVQVADRWFVNFADAPALVAPSPHIVYRYADRIDDEAMKSFAGWSAAHHEVATKGVSDSIGRQLPALFNVDKLLAVEGRQPLPKDVWFSEIQVMTARDKQGSFDGFFVAAKGGHNAESHNHNDIGNFVVYIDGKPLFIDAGVETYTKKTFSPERYEIWTMQSGWHSVPTINGAEQVNGRDFAASSVTHNADDDRAALKLDLTNAYPEDSGIDRWTRAVQLNRGKSVQVTDDYDLSAESPSVRLQLVTPSSITVDGSTIRLTAQPLADGLSSASGRVTLPDGVFSVTQETLELEDPRLQTIWGGKLHRILLDVQHPEKTGSFTISISR